MRALQLLSVAVVTGFGAGIGRAQPAEQPQGADWELRALGVADNATLQWMKACARRRPVTLAVVGEGGVSQAALAPLLTQGNTLEYREGASDPNAETHDTGQLRVILDLALRLGVRLRVLVYQPPDDFAAVGEALGKAGEAADVVVCFHSFWGGEVVTRMAERVRQASGALFVAPYGEVGEPRTGTSWQAHAAKPEGGGVPNFVTCIPLAQKSPGELLKPAARDGDDTETINFIAPSYYANGSGGTCPAAATTAAVSAYIVAASTRKPTPAEITELLRETATVDRAALTSVPEMDEAGVDRLQAEIARLVDPAQNGGQRKLDAAGVLSLRGIYRQLVAESLPPPAQAPRGQTRPMAPSVKVGEGQVVLENAHLRATMATQPTLSLSGLFSKHADGSCLAGGQTSHLFAVAVDDRLLTSDQFRVTGVQPRTGGGQAEVTLDLESDFLRGRLTARLDASWQMRLSLTMTNADAQPHRVRLFWVLNHLQIGEGIRDNCYFYPFKGGWSSGVPYHLGHCYGSPTGSMQVMDVFNPGAGAGVCLWTADADCHMKALWLRKVEQEGAQPPGYESMREPARAEKLPLDLGVGVSLAISPLPETVEAGASMSLPEAVVGVHPGDWHEALSAYTAWVRTWWQPPTVPAWVRRCFGIPSAHNHESLKQMRYRTTERLLPRYDQFQWAYWWKRSDTDRLGQDPKPDRWYRETHGDYDYEDRWGGLPAFREEIGRVHAAGSRVVLYAQSYLIWKHTKLGQAHGGDWVARNAAGEPFTDWTSPDTNMDVWDFCVGCPEYQDYVAQSCQRLLRDTGADGIYLDSSGDAYPCSDRRHGHGDEPAEYSLAMLQKVRPAIKAANPEAILQIEDVCSERHMQYIDGAWQKEFEAYPPMSNYTPHFDAYPVYFLRFYFPEVWFADWGVGDDPTGWRRCFFNGIGISQWPSDYTARTCRVMRENAEAFASLHPEPLIPTEQTGVFANRFPLESKVVCTLYNRNADTVSGPLLRVPHRKGRHYVDLLTGAEVGFTVDGASAVLSAEVPPNEVVAIGQLPS
ncbi:MAG: hypothetical protein FJX75_22945, partial [Armatimonadetes bacterium]|nr:hypothetical protein [Armatimonadota bacterium]